MKNRLLQLALVLSLLASPAPGRAGEFNGRFYHGTGDVDYLRLLDTARSMFVPNPELQNLAMLYMPSWNGLVEGPTWDAWWIQNSYGTTFSLLPFLQEPFVTFLQNSQDLWFDQMGDGKRVGAAAPFNWVAPDGALCDAARPGFIIYKQGDGRTHLHDWGMEFTAAGLLLQSELLLIARDPQAIARYLPRLERCARFIETRRDPTNNLFLAGAAGNLLAPSFAGWKKPDGTYGKAYHAGLSVTYIAALQRLIELEKLANRPDQARLYTDLRNSARAGLKQMATPEGYFINSLDPDGTRHGVFGAPKHGYFESSVNHDAIAFRVVDQAQAERIYAKIASIPGLRPHSFIIPNYPGYDDMYEKPGGLWAFGTWVNGGHWSTCEARMILGYYRLEKFDDARRSMRQLLTFAERFRMDNPLVKFGSDVYQPGQPVNLTYDAFGPPAAFVRGLFEYGYSADALLVIPHIPPGITRLEQRFPIRFGRKQLYFATTGQGGSISAVRVNGQALPPFNPRTVRLPYDQLPDRAAIEIVFGDAPATGFQPPVDVPALPPAPRRDLTWPKLARHNLATNPLPFRIGGDSLGQHCFKGAITRAWLFSRALNSNEIASLYRAPHPHAKDPALVGRWSFAELKDNAFLSQAEPGLPARVAGNVTVVDSPHGKAARLDGRTYLEVAPHPALNLTETCTLAAWIFPEELPPGGSRILDKSEVGTSNGYLLDTFPANSLRVISQAGTLVHDAKLTTNRWTHVAATVGSAGQLALYVDGQLVSGQTSPKSPDLRHALAMDARLRNFHHALVGAGQGDTYEAAHARVAIECLSALDQRLALLATGKLRPLTNPASQAAADQSYLDTVVKLSDGLAKTLKAYAPSADARKQQVTQMWEASAAR